MKTYFGFVLAAVVAAGVFVSFTTAAQAHNDVQNTGHTPITICHWADLKYLEITIDMASTDDHHQDDRDIIPAPPGGCPSSPEATVTPKPPYPTDTPVPTSTSVAPTNTPTVTTTATTTATSTSTAVTVSIQVVSTTTPTATATQAWGISETWFVPSATATVTPVTPLTVIKLPETGSGGYLPH